MNKQALDDTNCKLQSLQVQKKFSDCTELEAETKVWKRIVDGLQLDNCHSSSDAALTPYQLLPTYDAGKSKYTLNVAYATALKRPPTTSSMAANKHWRMVGTHGDMTLFY